MSKQLKELVKIIQAKRGGWTVEDVAKSVGYSRVHLTRLYTEGDTSDVEDLLRNRHADVLQNVPLSAGAWMQEKALKGSEEHFRTKYLRRIEKENEQLQKDKERLHKLLEDNQEIIKTNLTMLLALAKTLSARQIAIGETTLQSLERLEKKKRDSLVVASDKIIDQIQEGTYARSSVPG